MERSTLFFILDNLSPEFKRMYKFVELHPGNKFPLPLFLRRKNGEQKLFVSIFIEEGCTIEGILFPDMIVVRDTLAPYFADKENLFDMIIQARKVYPDVTQIQYEDEVRFTLMLGLL